MENFERLKKFKAENGHPHAQISDAFVGPWVKEQRQVCIYEFGSIPEFVSESRELSLSKSHADSFHDCL